jgi:hypothetical protein
MLLARVGEWRGRTVEVTARFIPKYLWMTASIDVYLDSGCVLQTGGKLESTGSVIARFYDSGSTHDIELRWGRGALRSFPITIMIDGALVAGSRVFVSNWPLALWPFLLFVTAAAWALWR